MDEWIDDNFCPDCGEPAAVCTSYGTCPLGQERKKNTMDEKLPDYIEYALLTWYSEDHSLHLDLKHPAMKLSGEIGELIDLWAKNEYKPGFDWWKCKHCKQAGVEYNTRAWCNPIRSKGTDYTPLVLDEIGDIDYYLRILSYITGKELFGKYYSPNEDIDKLLLRMSLNASIFAFDAIIGGKVDISRLRLIASHLEALVGKLGVTLEEVREMNYKKLNGDDSHHGWANA